MSHSLPFWAVKSSRVLLLGRQEWLVLKNRELRECGVGLCSFAYPPEDPEGFETVLKHRSLFQDERWLYLLVAPEVENISPLLTAMPSDPKLHLIVACSNQSLEIPPGFAVVREEEDRDPYYDELPLELQEQLNLICEGNPLKRFELVRLLKLASDPEPPRSSDLLWFSKESAGFDGMRFAQYLCEGDFPNALGEIRRWEVQGGSAATLGRDLLGAVGYRLRQVLKERIRRRLSGQRESRPYTLAELSALLESLRELDRLLKTTTLPASLLLRHFLIQAMRTYRQ